MAATRSPGLLSDMSAWSRAFFISPSNGSRLSAFSASFLTPTLASISIALISADFVSTSCDSTLLPVYRIDRLEADTGVFLVQHRMREDLLYPGIVDAPAHPDRRDGIKCEFNFTCSPPVIDEMDIGDPRLLLHWTHPSRRGE